MGQMSIPQIPAVDAEYCVTGIAPIVADIDPVICVRAFPERLTFLKGEQNGRYRRRYKVRLVDCSKGSMNTVGSGWVRVDCLPKLEQDGAEPLWQFRLERTLDITEQLVSSVIKEGFSEAGYAAPVFQPAGPV
jgi:hypothetical protein